MFDDELAREEREELWSRATELIDELYSVLSAIEAPDGFLDDLSRIEEWLNL